MVFSTSSNQSSTFPVGYRLVLNGTHSPSPENIEEIRKSSSKESWREQIKSHLHSIKQTTLLRKDASLTRRPWTYKHAVMVSSVMPLYVCHNTIQSLYPLFNWSVTGEVTRLKFESRTLITLLKSFLTEFHIPLLQIGLEIPLYLSILSLHCHKWNWRDNLHLIAHTLTNSFNVYCYQDLKQAE